MKPAISYLRLYIWEYFKDPKSELLKLSSVFRCSNPKYKKLSLQEAVSDDIMRNY